MESFIKVIVFIFFVLLIQQMWRIVGFVGSKKHPLKEAKEWLISIIKNKT
jgi:Na+-transporting methylmalonyl-CoA/oxaloacetate decarboxylase gamma subunit